MRHTIYLSSLLALLWLLNSGHYTPLILFLGLFSIAFVTFIARRMDVVDHESQPLYLTKHFPYYYWWLTLQVASANIDVVKRIWKGNSSINPAMGLVKADQRSDIGKVIFANSITLTPGTVSINIIGDKITVHALTQEALNELMEGEMNRQVKRLEE